MESASVKQWPLKLGNAFSFSDTVPGGIICALRLLNYKLAVVKVPYTPVNPCWECKLQIWLQAKHRL